MRGQTAGHLRALVHGLGARREGGAAEGVLIAESPVAEQMWAKRCETQRAVELGVTARIQALCVRAERPLRGGVMHVSLGGTWPCALLDCCAPHWCVPARRV